MSTYVDKAIAYNQELKDALQLIFDELNHGQRQKLAKNATIKALLGRYGVQYNG